MFRRLLEVGDVESERAEACLEVKSQNVQRLPSSGHLVENPRQTVSFGALFEFQMSKKCIPLWRETHLEVKSVKNCTGRTTWKLKCRKSARGCGAKHVWKSKCIKHRSSGHLVENPSDAKHIWK